jgi:hypothetical protein
MASACELSEKLPGLSAYVSSPLCWFGFRPSSYAVLGSSQIVGSSSAHSALSTSREESDDILPDLAFRTLERLDGDPTGLVVAEFGGDFADRAAMVEAAELWSEELSCLSASMLVLSVLTTALANECFLIDFGLVEVIDDFVSTLVDDAFLLEGPRLKTDFAVFRAKDSMCGLDSRAGVLMLFSIGGSDEEVSFSTCSSSSTSPSSAIVVSRVGDGRESSLSVQIPPRHFFPSVLKNERSSQNGITMDSAMTSLILFSIWRRIRV